MRSVLAALAWLVAAPPSLAADRYFETSDGVRLHYIEVGQGPRTIVLVPGWTMPAWIFGPQIQAFALTCRVVALDPRSQGESEIARSGHEPYRRGRDIAELVQRVGGQPLVLGWSLGVLDVLSYVHQYGDSGIAGLVLVDNSVGEDPPPTPSSGPVARGRSVARHRPARSESMRGFVRSMFRVSPSSAYVDRLTQAALRTPPAAAAALLAYPVPREFWREAVYSTLKPVLYLVTPRLAGQASNLQARHPSAESVVLGGVGHAMFVDDPARFDAIVENFMRRRVWP